MKTIEYKQYAITPYAGNFNAKPDPYEDSDRSYGTLEEADKAAKLQAEEEGRTMFVLEMVKRYEVIKPKVEVELKEITHNV